jgi:hypothetical protein
VTAQPEPDRPAYDLLPLIYRLRDGERRLHLSAFLGVVEDELRRLRQDVDGLYDDWFVETCAEWVVPYIGDLLGIQGLRAVPGGAVSQRALVANTIRYRRGKGTPAVLERVARDVTGWPARVVEYFQLLGTTQHLDHLRLQRSRTADLRDAGALALTGTPFDTTSRTVDVRHIDSSRGRYDLPHVGLHLWRLAAYRVEGGDARATDAARERWTFDPAGRDVPLFHPAGPAPADQAHLAQEHEVAGPLTRRALLRDLAAQTPVYLAEPDPALRVALDGTVVPRARLLCADLSDWHRPPSHTPGPVVAVDPRLGRLTVSQGAAPQRIQVGYAYGAPGDLGAGPYDRRPALTTALEAAGMGARESLDWFVRVSRDGAVTPGRTVRTLQDALLLWQTRPNLQRGQVGVIAVTDSATYTGNLQVQIPPGDTLLLVAASLPPGEPPPAAAGPTAASGPAGTTSPPLGLADVRLTAAGLRPHVIGDITVTGQPDGGGQFVLDGLSVEGTVTVAAGDLATLVVSDTTLIAPAAPVDATDGVTGGWIRATGNPHLGVHLLRAICAGLDLTGVPALSLADSLLYAGQAEAGAPAAGAGTATVEAAAATTHLDACTVLGRANVRGLAASNAILTGPVQVSHRTSGCVRFSYVAPGSSTPRRYRCQPRDEATAAGTAPTFTSIRPQDPGFGQLSDTCPGEITTGADDEGELGAFHFLHQSVRLANLGSQLDQYLRFGLEAGVFFTT